MRNAARVAACGTSHDAITTRAARSSPCCVDLHGAECCTGSRRDRDAVVAVVDRPGSARRRCASPSACSTCVVSMPSRRHRSSAICPNSSLPMRAITAVRAPWRAHATAAFDPLPPGLISNEWASTVSPRAIGRATRDTRSAFQLATQTTSLIATKSFGVDAIDAEGAHCATRRSYSASLSATSGGRTRSQPRSS